MRMRTYAMAFLAMIATTGLSARADFTPIAQPDAAYTSSTTLIDISGIPDGTTGITSVTQGPQTLNFDQSLTKASVPIGWATWGSPPNTESNTPPVLFQTTSNTLQILMSLPTTTFGFELQGNGFTINEFAVQFYEGANLVGNIPLFVDGNGGALLFAAMTTDSPFTSVVINNVDGQSGGFAIAQLRFTAVPEPASIAMVAQAIVAVGFYGWRKRRQAAQNA
jgi:hypothetical protein